MFNNTVCECTHLQIRVSFCYCTTNVQKPILQLLAGFGLYEFNEEREKKRKCIRNPSEQSEMLKNTSLGPTRSQQ